MNTEELISGPHHQENWVGLSGTVLNWFESYLKDRDYFVAISNYISEHTKMTCGVPLGCILGPLLFNIYILPLAHIIENKKYLTLTMQMTQIYITISPGVYGPIQVLTTITTINKSLIGCAKMFSSLTKIKFKRLSLDPKMNNSKSVANVEDHKPRQKSWFSHRLRPEV